MTTPLESPLPTWLVTGGAGFIGSCFVRRTIASGLARVVTLDKLTYAGNLENLMPAAASPLHTLVKGDIRNAALVRDVFETYAPSAVVHFAAESHVDRSIDGPRAFGETNVMGTLELLEAARRHHQGLKTSERDRFRFLQVSTDEVFGSLGDEGVFTETSPYAPRSPYAASKAGADMLVRAYGHTYGLPILVTHGANTFGPYQFPEKLLPVVIARALRAESIPVYGDGQQQREWIYVEDHAKGIARVLALGKPGESYALGGHHRSKNLDLVRSVCNVLDEVAPRRRPAGLGSYQDLVTFVDDRPGHDQRYALDSSKARDELGWHTTHPFGAWLRSTVLWYLENEAWWAGSAS